MDPEQIVSLFYSFYFIVKQLALLDRSADKMCPRYKNKVVVVTGGSKGIGRGVVRVFGTRYLPFVVIETGSCALTELRLLF